MQVHPSIHLAAEELSLLTNSLGKKLPLSTASEPSLLHGFQAPQEQDIGLAQWVKEMWWCVGSGHPANMAAPSVTLWVGRDGQLLIKCGKVVWGNFVKAGEQKGWIEQTLLHTKPKTNSKVMGQVDQATSRDVSDPVS